eukprot:g68157.t1
MAALTLLTGLAVASVYGQTTCEFRIIPFDLRDPHVFVQYTFLCVDITDGTPISGTPGLNQQILNYLSKDGNNDGYYDLSMVLTMDPFSMQPAGGLLEWEPADCTVRTAANPVSVCTTKTPPYIAPTPYTSMAMGTCLNVISGTVKPYTPPVTVPTAPCFSSASTNFVLEPKIIGTALPLYDAKMGATVTGQAPYNLTNGLLYGFLKESDANTIRIPANVAFVGNKTIANLLPGGTGSCRASDNQKDTHPVYGTGWWMYFNFAGEGVKCTTVPSPFPTPSRSPAVSSSASASASASAALSASSSASASPSASPSASASASASASPSHSVDMRSAFAGASPSRSGEFKVETSPSLLASASATVSMSVTHSTSLHESPSIPISESASASLSEVDMSPTMSPTPSESPSPMSASHSSSSSPLPSVTASVTPAMAEASSISPSSSEAPSISETPSITPTISETPSITPTSSETPSITPTISESPSQTPSISVSISESPSKSPSPLIPPCTAFELTGRRIPENAVRMGVTDTNVPSGPAPNATGTELIYCGMDPAETQKTIAQMSGLPHESVVIVCLTCRWGIEVTILADLFGTENQSSQAAAAQFIAMAQGSQYYVEEVSAPTEPPPTIDPKVASRRAGWALTGIFGFFLLVCGYYLFQLKKQNDDLEQQRRVMPAPVPMSAPADQGVSAGDFATHA